VPAAIRGERPGKVHDGVIILSLGIHLEISHRSYQRGGERERERERESCIRRVRKGNVAATPGGCSARRRPSRVLVLRGSEHVRYVISPVITCHLLTQSLTTRGFLKARSRRGAREKSLVNVSFSSDTSGRERSATMR